MKSHTGTHDFLSYIWHDTQGSDSGCGSLEILGVSQVEKREYHNQAFLFI